MKTQLKIDVKICGLRDAQSIDCAVEGGANHIGFIFFPKSPRNVLPEEAGALATGMDQSIRRVGVSVNADDGFLDRIVEEASPHILQLHGNESAERVREVKLRYGLPVMKALAIRCQRDFDAAQKYIGVADRLLFDAKPPVGSDLPGGNGVSFDWDLFARWQQNTYQNSSNTTQYPMLSGGINLNNIVAALGSSNARAIDISSGVEKTPGVKDPALIKTFLSKIKELELRIENCE